MRIPAIFSTTMLSVLLAAANACRGWERPWPRAPIEALASDQGQHRDQHRGREGEHQLTERDSRHDDRADHVPG